MEKAKTPARESSRAFGWAVDHLRNTKIEAEVTVQEIKELAACSPYGYPTAFQTRWLYSGADPVDAKKKVWKLRPPIPEEEKARQRAHAERLFAAYGMKK